MRSSTPTPRTPGGSRERVYEHNAVLDSALTALFAFEALAFFRVMSGDDLWLLGACFFATALFIVVTKAATRVTFAWLSRTLLSDPWFDDPLSRGHNMAKFCDQMWQLLIHVSMSVFELYVHGDRGWFSDPRAVWLPHPHQQTQPPGLRVLYLMQLGIWMYTSFSHRFLEPRRKDYYVMYIHHVTTIALVGFSYCGNYLRIGLLVLIVHDMSDVPVDVLKMVNLLKLEGSRGWFVSEIMFLLNLFTWAYYRLYLFLAFVIRNAALESHRLLVAAHPGQPWFNLFPEEIPWYPAFIALLLTLWVLHCWWFYLMLRIAYKLFNAPSAHQVAREEYEGTSASESDADEHPSGTHGAAGTARLEAQAGQQAAQRPGKRKAQ